MWENLTHTTQPEFRFTFRLPPNYNERAFQPFNLWTKNNR